MIAEALCAKVLKSEHFDRKGCLRLATSEVKGHRPFHLELYGARLHTAGRWPTPVNVS